MSLKLTDKKGLVALFLIKKMAYYYLSLALLGVSFLKNNTRYCKLFENLPHAFAMFEVVFDDSGHPADYIFCEANDSLAKIVKLKKEDTIGKTINEVLPRLGIILSFWLDRDQGLSADL